jgi:hypothetical protein
MWQIGDSAEKGGKCCSALSGEKDVIRIESLKSLNSINMPCGKNKLR